MYQRVHDLLGKERAEDLLFHDSDKFLWSDVVVINDDELKQMGFYEKYNEGRIYEGAGDPLPQERQPWDPVDDAAAIEKELADSGNTKV